MTGESILLLAFPDARAALHEARQVLGPSADVGRRISLVATPDTLHALPRGSVLWCLPDAIPALHRDWDVAAKAAFWVNLYARQFDLRELTAAEWADAALQAGP